MKNKNPEESFKLYHEELTFCLGESASLRKVLLMSAIIEAQVAWVGQALMKSKNFKYTPNEAYEFKFYSDILKANLSFPAGFWSDLGEFKEGRNLILHKVFKKRLHSRKDLDESINHTVKKGRGVINHLDERLMFLGNSNE